MKASVPSSEHLHFEKVILICFLILIACRRNKIFFFLEGKLISKLPCGSWFSESEVLLNPYWASLDSYTERNSSLQCEAYEAELSPGRGKGPLVFNQEELLRSILGS